MMFIAIESSLLPKQVGDPVSDMGLGGAIGPEVGHKPLKQILELGRVFCRERYPMRIEAMAESVARHNRFASYVFRLA